MQTNQSRVKTPITFFIILFHSWPESTCPHHPIARCRTTGTALCPRVYQNYSSQSILSLCILLHPFLPLETIIKALSTVPPFSASWQTWVLPCVATHDMACPASWKLWVINSAINGKHLWVVGLTLSQFLNISQIKILCFRIPILQEKQFISAVPYSSNYLEE